MKYWSVGKRKREACKRKQVLFDISKNSLEDCIEEIPNKL